jgi:hypothetical protein
MQNPQQIERDAPHNRGEDNYDRIHFRAAHGAAL